MHPDARTTADLDAAMTPGSQYATFIASLTEQFAAGQSETLYSLHTAGATLRRQAQALQSAIEQLPAELEPTVRDELTRIAEETTASAVEAIEVATAALASSAEQLTASAASFTADARASADAVTAVGENVISRLMDVLDARDASDKALENRLNARIDRLTKRAETTVNRLIADLAEETAQLRAHAEAERTSTAQQLAELLDRLLAQPRGKLKDLRNNATKETKA
ncbi:MAG: hypothetical protein JWO12_3125 [Frankiales bacterium]|nr:hypothetical protein [Frankiales bacterium]